MDATLISAAVGSTLFTLYILESDPPTEPSAAPAGPRYRAAVLHVLGLCNRVRLPQDAHFLITASGEVHPTVRWERRDVLPSTASRRVNRVVVVVALEPPGSKEVQREALRKLLAGLERDYPGIAQRCFPHARVEPEGCGRFLLGSRRP